MGRLRETVLGIKAANAFQNTRGATELQNSSNSIIPDEPEEDPPASAQQSLSQPYRQNSGYGQPWSPPPVQSFGPPFQSSSYFAHSQQHHQPTQYYDAQPHQSPPPQQSLPPQQSPPLQQGWQQQQEQQPYSPRFTQPPQTPPNPARYSGYPSNGYASPVPSNYEQSMSSANSQNSQYHYQMSPPPMNASPPTFPPQRTSTMFDNTPTQFEPPPSLPRSQTVPVTAYWPREQKDHDCSDYRAGYPGQCSRCFPQG